MSMKMLADFFDSRTSLKVRSLGEYVEARQSERAAGDVAEGDKHSNEAQRHQRPLVDEHRRSDSERNNVRQAVELGAEETLSLGEAGNSTIEAIEKHGEEDRQGSLVELRRSRF